MDIEKKQNNYTVYIHKNKFNNKMYIGITSQLPEKRWLNGHGYSFNPHFNSAIKKYGWDNFEHIIYAENLSKECAENLEITLISKYKTTNQLYGYNLSNGGNSVGKHTEETRKKISASHIGIGHTDETKKKLSDMFTGRKLTKEWIENRSRSQTGLKRNTKTIERISEANSIPVICINNRIIYKSLTEASKKTNVNISHISDCCNGKRPRAGTDENGNGLFWMFYEKYLEENLDSKSNYEIIPKLKKEKCKLKIRCIEDGKIYNSVNEVHQLLNIPKSSLSSCLHGKYAVAGNLHWEYVQE